MVSSGIPSGSGKKDNENSCKWQKKDHISRDVLARIGTKSGIWQPGNGKEESPEPYEFGFP